MTDVGNQFTSQTLGDTLAATFNTVGGRVFPDPRSQTGLEQFLQVIDSWRATHAQTYGAVIPSTATSYNVTVTDLDTPTDLIAAGATEVVFVNAISVENRGAAGIDYELYIGTTYITGGSIAAGVKQGIGLNYGLQIAKNEALNVVITSGTTTDLLINASGVKSCV